MYIELLQKQILFFLKKMRLRKRFPFLECFSDEQILGRYYKNDVEFFIWTSALNIVARNKKINIVYIYSGNPRENVFYYFRLFDQGNIKIYDEKQYSAKTVAKDVDPDLPLLVQYDLYAYDEGILSGFAALNADLLVIRLAENSAVTMFVHIGEYLQYYGYVFDSTYGQEYCVFVKIDSINAFPSLFVEKHGLGNLMSLACVPKNSEFRWPQ